MPAKIRRFLRPRAALFAAAVFCLPALFSAQDALAQPTSVKLEQNHRDSGGSSLIEVRWAAPASGTVTAYKVRWAQGAGSTALGQHRRASGVSVAAGTLSYTITEPEDEDFPGNLADGRYDVQVGAEVSGATAWSASAGIVVGSSSLTSLTLGLYVGSELFRSQVIDLTGTSHSLDNVSSFVDGIAATATTLGGGDFQFGPAANRRRAASGASTEVIPLAPGSDNSFQAIEAETDDGQLGPLIQIYLFRA